MSPRAIIMGWSDFVEKRWYCEAADRAEAMTRNGSGGGRFGFVGGGGL